MKRRIIVIILLFLVAELFQATSSYPYGLITHIGQAQDVINKAKAGDSSVPADVAAIITKSPKTEKAFRSGALDGDILNFVPFNSGLARTTHEKCSASIASALLKNAKTDEEKAYAYGWAFVHLPGDVIGHGSWVNDVVGKTWDYEKSSFSDTNGKHIETERIGDWHALNKFGFNKYETETGVIINNPKLNLDIDIPVLVLRKSITDAYGLSATSPSALYEEIAEMAVHIFLYSRANMLAQSEYPDNPNFKESYYQALDLISGWMKNRSLVNENYNLDNGKKQTNTCEQLPQATQIPNPGGDHPDETYDVATLQAAGEVTFNDWLRVATKKEKQGALFFWQLKNKLNEFKALPTDTDPIVKELKRKELIDFYRANVNNADIVEAFRESNPLLIEDLSTVEDVAILNNGYPYEAASLIAKFKEPAIKVPADFTLEAMKDKRVLVISSGGLYGLENSAFFRASLDEYVKNGGTLIVFAQQHGYEFSALPVPQEADGTYKTITGYGWTEDQSCFTNAVYIDTWHQILSGQNCSTPTLNVDGYFTGYPSNATVLLRRTVNGQPAMLMYNYGLGNVIVTSMYSDWAYGHSQASSEEIALVRDLISWAKKPEILPEIHHGETASVTIEVVNNSDTDATSAKLLVYNPDRSTLLSKQTINLSIPAGQTDTISVSYTSSSTSTLGIYRIDYELYDANGIIVQPQSETDSGRFVVSNPLSNPYKSPNFNFSIQSDAEQYLYGTPATFTVIAWNNTDINHTITFRYYLPHLGPSGTYTGEVPAKSSASFNIVVPEVKYQGWLYGTFYDESGKVVGSAQKGIWMVGYPSANISVTTNKAFYARGETINLTLNLQNKQGVDYTITLKVRISDPSNVSIYSNSLSVILPANGTSTQNLSFALSSTALRGYYIVSAEAYDSTGKKIGGSSTSFELPQSQIIVTPNLPSTSNSGTNNVSFTISNTGRIGVSSGTLDVSLKDPDGTVIYTGNQPFSIGVGQNITLNFPVSIPSLKFGNYTLTYTQSDETRTGNPTNITISNSATIAIAFDKSSYRMRETANLTATITNTGKFNLDPSTDSGVSVTVSVTVAGYTNTQTVSVPVSEHGSQFTYAIPIPETITAGQHNVNVTLALPSGSSVVQSSKFTVPESSLEIVLSASGGLAMTGQTTLTAGDTINLTIENAGGVDTSYATEKLSITDSKGVVIYQGNVIGNILAGEKKSFTDIQIPSQTVNGSVLLSIQIKDNKTLKSTYLSKILNITGLTATLQTRIDKDEYLKTETITDLSSIANGGFEIEAGSLKLVVTKTKTSLGEFRTIVGGYGNGDGQFNKPYGIAVDDSYIYVVDTNNHRVQIFNKSTYAFVAKFGSYGSGNGQFYYPRGIAVDNNYIYVTEYNRIQIFNKLTYAYFNKIEGSNLSGIAVDDKYIYVVISSYPGWVSIYDKTTYAYINSLQHHVYSGFVNPIGVAVDNNYIYVTDTAYSWFIESDMISVFRKTDYWLHATFGGCCSGDRKFWYPYGVALDNNYIYIADSGNNRVQIFNKSTYAFIGKFGSYGNGNSQFNWPQGIAVGSDGSVYVADTENHRIQRMVPAGGGAETLFETTLSINQTANTTQDYTTNIGILNATGKLYLQAELKNSLGQSIATAAYPFYIIEGNTLLLFSTDKKFYKPNETIIITGEVRNLASITASALSLQLSANNQNIYAATFDVPANGTHPFTVTMNTSTEGTYTLTGKVTQNNSTLVEIADSYEVANPKVSATVSTPGVAGNEPFNIDVEMKNEGKVNASIQLSAISDQGNTIDDQQITIPAGETKLIQYSQQVTSDTIYTFTFYGDLEQTITKTVKHGLSASISVDVSNGVYPEGRMTIPVTINNTGQLYETLGVIFQLSSQQSVVSSQNKTYYVPKGGNVTDILYYDLTEGEYQLTANSQLPTTSAEANFSIKKENKVDMAVSLGTETNELIPVTMNLANIGYNSIGGSIRCTVVNSQNAAAWSGDIAVSQLLPQNSQLITFNINPAAIATGNYTLNVELLNDSGQQLAAQGLPITIQGPIFRITQSLPYQTFYVGQEATFTFRIKNTGNQEGAFDFNLKAYDLIDSTQREWLKPGEEKAITFNFLLPEDLEEKDYFADYELKDQGPVVKGQVKYRIAGIALDVNASLGKQYYHEGETARLTILISQQSALGSQNLFARVNYNGYEDQQSFTLNGSYTLTFDIPLTNITEEKLFYGIYYESGRSIHLNSLYIYKAGDVITIITDKQVYNPGGTVSVSVNSVSGITNGTMTLSGPNYTETFAFTGKATRSFVLPARMTAGTYNISCQLSSVGGETYTANHPIDVAGIQVKVLECKNDKGKYASSDTITANFTISSNKAMPAILKAWVVEPEGKYISVSENSINLSSSEPLLFTDHYPLTTAISGIHRLVYGIYNGDLLLVLGSEAFDVGDAVLLGLSTDKSDYPINTEPVNVKVSMFGTVDAKLELVLDGTTVETQSVSLNGFVTLDIEIGIVEPGTHILRAILTAGGLRSAKETSFVYGSSLPDLTTEVRIQNTEVRKDNTIQIAAIVTNQCKIPSSATIISLYDRDNLIETKPINALNSGESQEINIILNMLGKIGEHTIKAVVDPENSVIEFNEENNTTITNILIPDITLITETGRDIYKIRQKVNILSTITNLTSSKTYSNLELTTFIRDPSGREIFSKSTAINFIQPLSSITNAETWDTTGLPVDGTYTITHTIISGYQILARSFKTITLEKAPDFRLRYDTDYRKIKQGEKATYILNLESLNGWRSEVSLRIEGLPESTSVSFSPGNLMPPGDALIAIITTDTTPAGTYTLNLIAEGIDEGDVITHTLPLTLDVSGFGLEVEPLNRTIQQLECAIFNISLLSMNEYEGEINLSIDRLPYGVNAYFEKSILQERGNVKLTAQTSKYVRPGTYTFTITGDDGLVKHSLNLNLAVQPNPDISAGIITTQGPGPSNEARIRAFNSRFEPVLDLMAFNTKYGASATSADIDGDGYDEIIVSQGPDPKNAAMLRVFKRDGTTVTEYTAFDSKYGLTISSADFDGDWLDELIVGMGPDPKNPAQLRILKYNGNGFTEIMTQTVYIDLKYGLNTAAGDLDGDGLLEIITAPGPGPNNPAVITVWKDTGGYLTELCTFTAFEGNYGANISTGDIDGDGKAEIITGTGPDPKNPSVIRVFKSGGNLMLELRPYNNRYGYGVTVASTDLDEDGIDEIITGAGFGPQNQTWIKVFKADGTEAANFLAYPKNIRYGVKVSTGKTGE